MSAGRLVAIGEIGRPHGLRGEFRVTPLTDHPGRFDRLADCVLWDPERELRDVRRVVSARRRGGAVILAVEGCRTVEAAAALRGRLVAVPEAQALPPPPGCFYPWQLAGARVVTEDGRAVGHLAAVEATAGHDLWVVRDGDREHLIPAVAAIVVDVDLGARRVVIRPPEGLLDL